MGPKTSELHALRFPFVTILFALVAEQIAERLAALLTPGMWPEAVAAASHLLLALGIVVTSWIGWHRSRIGRTLTLDGVFSRATLVLLADFLIVVLYFALVAATEAPADSQGVAASATVEARLVFCIFVAYLGSDLLTRWAARGANAATPLDWGRVIPTIAAAGLSGCIWLGVRMCDSQRIDVAVLVDAALLILVRDYSAPGLR